ncbi:hypothetical protein ACU4GD_37955 [Cupriavidus basilensis]
MTDQEKLTLYRNAADYAKEHHIQLGQASPGRSGGGCADAVVRAAGGA